MIINRGNLATLFTAYSAAFQNGFAGAAAAWNRVATETRSTTASNTYTWLGQAPGFREWIGERIIKDMQAHDYAIKNKSFESTVGVKRDDIEDDNIGVYTPLFSELGRASAAFPDELVFSMLKNGTQNMCYDGQNFFDNDHPVFSNVDGTGDLATVSNFFAGSKSDAWYLLDTSRALKPLILQKRKDAKLTKMDDDADEAVFMRNEFRYGVDLRLNAGYGFWQMASCSAEDLTAANFEKVFTYMRTLKSDGGRPLGIRPNLLLVPPTLLGKAEDILKVKEINGTTNKHFNRVELLEVDWLG